MTQFTPDRALQVIQEIKTQTRRLEHEGESIMTDGSGNILAVYSADKKRVRFAVDKTYSVQPGRGKPTIFYAEINTSKGFVRQILTQEDMENPATYEMMIDIKEARIRLLEIWREDVRNISVQDAIAEGFRDQFSFFVAWIMMYDRVMRRPLVRNKVWNADQILSDLHKRPAALYMAWALKFELVK